jgi:two-component system, sensor histidine kinase and response regulator
MDKTITAPKAKVLVVEDDIHLLEGIRDILELDGYDVLAAENGVSGIETLRKQNLPPDLIVSDIMMPKMDGIQFFKEVRKEDRWLGIPFIFLTAKGERQDVHKGMKLGVDDYVIKPYDPADLLVKIESRLERHRSLARMHNSGMSTLKKQILTMLNHEFRTPLTFVVAYTDLLTNPGDEKLSDEDLALYLRGISSGADRLRNLIENFIMLVELETESALKTFEWRKGPIGGAKVILEAAIDRVKELKVRKQTVTLELPEKLSYFVGDQEYLTVALSHLISNASKFSEEGASIEAGASSNNDEVTIWVRDHGRGIPAEEIDRIWDSFYQVDRQTYEDQGSGSGLAIVDGIVRLHEGRRAVESEVGKGSTFKLMFPVSQLLA